MFTSLTRCLLQSFLSPKQEFKWIFQQTCKSFFKRTINTSRSPNDLVEIRNNFLQYSGGSVVVKCNDETGIAELYFSHPEKRNAVTGTMMIQFADAVTQLENWSTGKGIILHSSGSIFCSGLDLDMVEQIGNSQQGSELATLMHDILQRFLRLPLISVTLVQGDAMGGGAELVTATDFRLMTARAHIQFVQAKFGVVTGWGGGTRLVNILGPSKALHILTSSQKISAQEAFDMNLVSAILKDEPDPLSQTRDWLLRITKPPHQVVRAIKTVVSTAASSSVVESLAEERKQFSSLWGGPAQKAALQKIIKHK